MTLPQGLNFDSQEQSFDSRAGLPILAREAVARMLMDEAALSGTGSLALEIGCGTGDIGVELAAGVPRYLGVDFSRGMLRTFARKLRPLSVPKVQLVQADGRQPWPVASRCAGLIFFSRSAHLLDGEALAQACLRVSQRALVAIGRLDREGESVRRGMRKKMRELLGERGVRGRSSARSGDELLTRLVEQGGTRGAELRVASWEVSESPAGALAAWRSKPGIAGRSIQDSAKAELLAELESWALNRYGSLDAQRTSCETYVLSSAKLPV